MYVLVFSCVLFVAWAGTSVDQLIGEAHLLSSLFFFFVFPLWRVLLYNENVIEIRVDL